MICPQCGSTVSDGASFCTNCGAHIAAQQPRYQQPQYQQPQYQQPQYQQNQNYQQPQYQQPQYQQYQQNQQYQQPQYQSNPYQQQYQYQPPQYGEPSHGRVDFIEAVRLFFVNYINFTGRASRSEYWWVVLFAFLAGIVASVLDMLLKTQVLAGLVSLAFLVPSLSLYVRRLHDIGKQWTWIFMGLIPFAGWIILIVYACRMSDNDNRWGPRPPMN